MTLTRLALSLAALLTLGAGPALAQGPDTRLLVPVPDVRQATEYTCGASALQAVLAYWGIERREATLAEALKATAEKGVNRHALIRVARDYGLTVTAQRPMTRATLLTYLHRGIPVILAIQAWSDTPVANYRTDWEDGHYVVAIGYDRDRLYVEDPSILGSRGFLSWAELDRRWHDCDFGPEDRYERLGIAIAGKRAQPAPALMHVD